MLVHVTQEHIDKGTAFVNCAIELAIHEATGNKNWRVGVNSYGIADADGCLSGVKFQLPNAGTAFTDHFDNFKHNQLRYQTPPEPIVLDLPGLDTISE